MNRKAITTAGKTQPMMGIRMVGKKEAEYMTKFPICI
jgi:hypothetical protein